MSKKSAAPSIKDPVEPVEPHPDWLKFTNTPPSEKAKKGKNSVLFLIIEYILDLVTFLDFISDGIIIYTLLYSKDVMWLCFVVMSILMPYIVAQIPYLGFKLSKNRAIYSEK